MRRWLVVWEVSVNYYHEVHYHGDSVAAVLSKWQAGHKKADVRSIVRIEEVGE